MAQGILSFANISDAIRAGYQIYDRRNDGSFIVRLQTERGWAMAVVDAAAA